MKGLSKIIRYYAIALAFMTLLRVLFIAINYSFIPIINASDWFMIALAGFRFDLSIVALLMTLLLFLFLLNHFIKNKTIEKLSHLLFHGGIFFILLSSLIDVFYFSFNLRRSTIENFEMMRDTQGSIFSIIKEQPFFILSLLLFLIAYFFVFKRFIAHKRSFDFSFLVAVVLLILNGVAIRGFNTSALSPLSVPLYTASQYTPYVSNAPQTLLFSFLTSHRVTKNEALKERNYFQQAASASLQPYIHKLRNDSFQKRNVVVFILESFSRSYLEKGNSLKAYTPFLDSIMANSLVCTNAYANGVISMNGVQNILSGIPTIESASMLSSPYYGNQVKAMPNLLLDLGYQTTFFHGFKKDLFGFERLTKKFGVQRYYSEEDCDANPAQEGIWGIHDRPFFAFAAKQLSSLQPPFFSSIFNISSHHPYKVPNDFDNKIPVDQTDVQRAISYVDFSLQEFFAYARKQDWYKNTLFVFTADHWNKEDATNFEKSGLNRHKIPLVFFAPYDSTLKGTYPYVVDQNSIYPSVMDLLGYSGKICSFGKSIKDTNNRAIAFMYQHPHVLEIVTDHIAVQYDKTLDKRVRIENYKNLNSLDTNLVGQAEDRLKAYIQNYSYAQRNNQLLLNKKTTN